MNGRFEKVQSALNKTAGVSDLKILGLYANINPKVKGQLIQYTGNAKVEDVIAILVKKTSFEVRPVSPAEKKKAQKIKKNQAKEKTVYLSVDGMC